MPSWPACARSRPASYARTATCRPAPRASPARCCTPAMSPDCRGTAWCARTGRWPRARASAPSSTPRACRSAGRGSTWPWHDWPAMWLQREIALRARPRGFHLITDEVLAALPELRGLDVGLCHLFIRHTSASLTLNENASPDVRRDFATWFDDAVPEEFRGWTHTLEGPDDMPAHVKASLLGPSLSMPVARGRLALGTWQGIYLCEHRDRGGARSLVATLNGQSRREL